MRQKTEIDVKYILYSQVLESLHRKTSKNNNLIFINRIKGIVSCNSYRRYLNIKRKDINKLCINIRNNRNYFTHYNERLENKVLTGIDLMFLCMKLELFIELHILMRLGLEVSDFSEMSILITDIMERKEKLTLMQKG